MLNIIVKIICAMLCSATIVYTINNILEKNNQNSKFKIVMIVILISVITYFSYGIDYNAESNLFRIILYIIGFKLVYNESIYKIIISTIICMILMSGCDLIGSIIFINFVPIEKLRGVWYWIILGNFVVCLLLYILISRPFIREKLKKFINNLNETKIISTIIILLPCILGVVLILYNISTNFKFNNNYIINFIIGITCVIIAIIFFKERLENNNLNMKYDALFDYFNEIEDSIDEIYFLNHEFKNQLAIIKRFVEETNNKECIKYINEINNDLKEEKLTEITELKNISNGGIKGLIYYKIILARKEKINITLNISKTVKKNLNKMSQEENKVLLKILGVIIDNSIDEVKESNKKYISIEIYNIENKVLFVVSNYINNKNISLAKIGNKGYTTKGNGHGKGLYLTRKLIARTKWISLETKVINNYYNQKIIIDLKSTSI